MSHILHATLRSHPSCNDSYPSYDYLSYIINAITSYIHDAMTQLFLTDWLILILWSPVMISWSPVMISWSPVMISWSHDHPLWSHDHPLWAYDPPIDYRFVNPIFMMIATILTRSCYHKVYISRSLFLILSIKPSLLKPQPNSALILLYLNFKASSCLLIPLVLHSREHFKESKHLPKHTTKKARLLLKNMNTISAPGLAQSWKRYSTTGNGL